MRTHTIRQWWHEIKAQWKTFRSGCVSKVYRARYTRTTVWYSENYYKLGNEAQQKVDAAFDKAREAFDLIDEAFDEATKGGPRG